MENIFKLTDGLTQLSLQNFSELRYTAFYMHENLLIKRILMSNLKMAVLRALTLMSSIFIWSIKLLSPVSINLSLNSFRPSEKEILNLEEQIIVFQDTWAKH